MFVQKLLLLLKLQRMIESRTKLQISTITIYTVTCFQDNTITGKDIYSSVFHTIMVN